MFGRMDYCICVNHLFLSMQQTIAVFDFDGTLTNIDTLMAFLKHTHKPVGRIFRFLLASPFLLLYKAGFITNGQAKQKLFSLFYRNRTIEEFNACCESFNSVIDKHIRPEVFQKLRNHLHEKHKTLIVSASIENWILPWAQKEGISEVIATRIEVSPQGKLTGRFLTPNCYGQEKVRRILQLFPERSGYTLIAYGDSKGDKEMLAMADEKNYINHI